MAAAGNESSKFAGICSTCVDKFLAFAKQLDLEVDVAVETDWHISLSRPFALNFHSIDSFMKRMASLPALPFR